MSPTQIGQTAGSIAGGAIAPGVGVPLGALVGTLAGMLVEGEVDRVREVKERGQLSGQLEQPRRPLDGAPQSAEVGGVPTRVWIDEQLVQGRLIPGHFELQTIR